MRSLRLRRSLSPKGDDMRIKIENVEDLNALDMIFRRFSTTNLVIEGHVVNGIDGTWLLIDKLGRS